MLEKPVGLGHTAQIEEEQYKTIPRVPHHLSSCSKQLSRHRHLPE